MCPPSNELKPSCPPNEPMPDVKMSVFTTALHALEHLGIDTWRMRQLLIELLKGLERIEGLRESEEYRYLQKIHSTISEYYFLTDLLEKHLWFEVQEHRLKTQQQTLRQWLRDQIPEVQKRVRQVTEKAA